MGDVADPGTTGEVTIATAQVIHGLTALAEDPLLVECFWPTIAQIALDQGLSWAALTDLVAINICDAIADKLGELHGQIDHYLADSPRLKPWDVVAGIYGRAWHMDLIDPISAVWRMDNLWQQIRDLDDEDSEGLDLIWAGMRVREQDDEFLTAEAIRSLAIKVLDKADLLLPPDALDRGLCKALREAFEANGY